MDITSGFNQIFSLILQGLKFCFDTLDKIQFLGISLLDFCIIMLILGIVLPIVLTLLDGAKFTAREYYKASSREFQRSNKDE